MKFATKITTLMVMAFCLFLSSATANELTEFTVVKISGFKKAKVKQVDGYSALKEGQKFPFGTTIKTGRRTTIDLAFSAENTFRLMPRTTLVIKEDSKNPKLKILKLESGTVQLKLDNFPRKHKLQVETPTAVCGAVGTRFVVSFEDDQKDAEINTLASTRKNTFSCSEGQVFCASMFNVKGKSAQGDSFEAPLINAGTQIAAVIHEGQENSFTDISVNRGSLTMNYGVKGSGKLTLEATENRPARFVCALEKSDDEVDMAVMEVKSGTVKNSVRKGFFVKSEKVTEIKAGSGPVVLRKKEVLEAKEAPVVAEYLIAAREEGEIHSQVVDKRNAGTATPADEAALSAAADKATTLRKQILTTRILRSLRQIQRTGNRLNRTKSIRR